MTKYPHVIAAVEARAKHERDANGKDLWAIGAAVIKDCWPNGRPDGAAPAENKLLVGCASELAKLGHDYSITTLDKMAATTHHYPVHRRHPDLSFFVHTEAHTPDLLDWIIKQVGKKNLSGRTARDWVNRWHAMEFTKRKQSGQTKMPTPKTSLAPPDEKSQHELAVMADVLDIDNDAVWMTKTLRTNLAKLEKLGVDNPDLTDSLVAHHLQVAEVATKVADLLSKTKRNRFTTIHGGKSA